MAGMLHCVMAMLKQQEKLSISSHLDSVTGGCSILNCSNGVKIWLSPACVVKLLESKVYADYLFLFIWQHYEYTALRI